MIVRGTQQGFRCRYWGGAFKSFWIDTCHSSVSKAARHLRWGGIIFILAQWRTVLTGLLPATLRLTRTVKLRKFENTRSNYRLWSREPQQLSYCHTTDGLCKKKMGSIRGGQRFYFLFFPFPQSPYWLCPPPPHPHPAPYPIGTRDCSNRVKAGRTWSLPLISIQFRS